MPVIYKKQPKRSLKDKSVRYFPTVKSVKLIREREVAKLLADETTLNAKEAEFALVQLQKILLRELQQGNTVQLGDWASFFLTVASDGTEKKEDCTASLIKTVRCHCRFTPSFRETLQKSEFVPLEDFERIKA
ncbi:MAG: DNA-binding protein [Bacteroidaceae bacterium]|nr:DNA-binding protein [Bacteroidaceae bacterium]